MLRRSLGIVVLLILSSAEGEEMVPFPDDCTCVPYYLCPNGSVIEDGGSLIDVRLRIDGCDNYLDVCCSIPPLEVPLEPGFDVDFEEGVSEFLDPKGSCGVLQPEGVAFRITGAGNNEAQFGEFPWMSAILLSKEVAKGGEDDGFSDVPRVKNVLLYLCGGSLIHPRVVMTAAHCVANHWDSTLFARVGEWDSQTNKEIYRHQDREVSEVLVHPDFRRSNLFNDVALLFLIEPVVPGKHIGFICLPTKGDLPPLDTRCWASGWGKDAFGKEGKYSSILKKVDLPVVPNGKCQHNLRKTRLGHYFKLDRSFMCAGGEKGKDTCKGDGGSPLVCPHPKNPDRFMQSGIVAWGIGCQEQEIPGVYANVALLREWIDEKMQEHDLETSYYAL